MSGWMASAASPPRGPHPAPRARKPTGAAVCSLFIVRRAGPPPVGWPCGAAAGWVSAPHSCAVRARGGRSGELPGSGCQRCILLHFEDRATADAPDSSPPGLCGQRVMARHLGGGAQKRTTPPVSVVVPDHFGSSPSSVIFHPKWVVVCLWVGPPKVFPPTPVAVMIQDSSGSAPSWLIVSPVGIVRDICEHFPARRYLPAPGSALRPSQRRGTLVTGASPPGTHFRRQPHGAGGCGLAWRGAAGAAGRDRGGCGGTRPRGRGGESGRHQRAELLIQPLRLGADQFRELRARLVRGHLVHVDHPPGNPVVAPPGQ